MFDVISFFSPPCFHLNFALNAPFFYQVDSVAEEVERKSSTSDMVNPCNKRMNVLSIKILILEMIST